MKIEFMFLANSAEVRDGLLFVMGGLFDQVTAPVLPGQLTASLVVRGFETAPKLRPHDIRVELKNVNAGSGQAIEGRVTVAPDADPSKRGMVLVVPLTGMPLLAYGRHEVTFKLDGRPMGTVGFDVVEPEVAPILPAH